MKIISWNVNGIKSKFESGDLEDLINKQKPDILCIQEIKTKNVPKLEGYKCCPYPSSKSSGYYGTAIYTKIDYVDCFRGFEDEEETGEFNSEGRVIKLEFENFNLYNVYAPTGAGNEDKFERKRIFYNKLTEYFKKSKKPVIICGDLNRMAAEIDAKRPELMKNKSGFKQEEQEWFEEILTDYIDAFRKFHKDGDYYTWWQSNILKEGNSGIRLDYFLVSKSLEDTLNDSYIYNQTCSDHSPIVLDINYCPSCKKGIESCEFCKERLVENDDEESISEDKLEIPKDKIILLDLNYTLISNSKGIFNSTIEEKIKSHKYDMDLIELIKDNYVILISSSPYKRSCKILSDLKEKTGFVPNESYWNFGLKPPELKDYWMKEAIFKKHGSNLDQYLAIDCNTKTCSMYKDFGIEARPKKDFI